MDIITIMILVMAADLIAILSVTALSRLATGVILKG
jgi:hypothetical protein